MPKTQVFNVDDDTALTLRRLTFVELRENTKVLEGLYGADTAQAVIFHDDFQAIMELACVGQESRDTFLDLDVNDAWDLWNKWVEFARLDRFFLEASDQQAARSGKLVETRFAAARRQVDTMKQSGVVPASFSIDDLLSRQMAKFGTPEASEDGDDEPVTMPITTP